MIIFKKSDYCALSLVRRLADVFAVSWRLKILCALFKQVHDVAVVTLDVSVRV
jgi:hypothetical protein